MSILRFHAIKESLNHKPIKVNEPARRSELLGEHVFNEPSMRQFLTKDSYKSVMSAVELRTMLDRKMADQMSTGMKQ